LSFGFLIPWHRHGESTVTPGLGDQQPLRNTNLLVMVRSTKVSLSNSLQLFHLITCRTIL